MDIGRVRIIYVSIIKIFATIQWQDVFCTTLVPHKLLSLTPKMTRIKFL